MCIYIYIYFQICIGTREWFKNLFSKKDKIFRRYIPRVREQKDAENRKVFENETRSK